MQRFVIRNESSRTPEIDVYGFIGEDWFGEGDNTLANVKNRIKNLQADEIIVNISSTIVTGKP